MTERTAWLAIVAIVVATLWLLAGAVVTVTRATSTTPTTWHTGDGDAVEVHP